MRDFEDFSPKSPPASLTDQPADDFFIPGLFKKLISIALGGFFFLGVALTSVHIYESLPELTYESIHSGSWKKQNVNTMTFETASDFQKAERSLLALTQDRLQRHDPVPVFLLADLYNMQDRPKEAEAYYRKTLRLIEQSWYHQQLYQRIQDDVFGALAILYYENNKNADSLNTLQKIKTLDTTRDAVLLQAIKDSLEFPERADFHMQLGQELCNYFKLEKARQEILLAQKLSQTPQLRIQAENYLKTQMPRQIGELSSMARYYSLAAETHQTEDAPKRAADFYERALREAPDFEWGYHELAAIYRQLEKYPEAVQHASSAIELNPDFYLPYLTRGDIALDQKHYHQAITYYQMAQDLINRFPDDRQHRLNANIENQIGYAYEYLGDFPGAMKHYQKALKEANLDEDMWETSSDYLYAQEAVQRLQGRQQSAQKRQGKHTISVKH